MHAIILAGGFGTRLSGVVSDVPKPLAPIAGRPFIAWLADYLIAQGITEITFSVHHQWQKICDYFSAHTLKVPVHYVVEETPLGTGGAMAHALKSLNIAEPVLVLNGDSFARVDYRALYAQHQKSGAKLTMVLREVADTERYGTVSEKNGAVVSFGPGQAGKAGLINAGIYVMHPQLFAEPGLPAAFSFERDFLPSQLPTLMPRSFHAEGYFVDIGIPEDYARACKELPRMVG